MSIIENIKNMFSSKQTENINEVVEQVKVDEVKNMFVCHHCNKEFELLNKNKFSVSVPKPTGDFFHQGIAVQCPYCFKNSFCN